MNGPLEKPDIHPSAIVSTEAKVGAGVKIGPYCLVEEDTTIGDKCVLHSHVVIKKGTHLGQGCIIHPFAVLGDDPQDIAFDSVIKSGVKIGALCQIRESFTVHRSTRENGFTQIGESCLLMAGSHVGHDCQLGNHVILVNQVMLAGHVRVGDYAFFGGGCGVHQFVEIGESVMLGGNGSYSGCIPPFLLVSGRDCIHGINLVGLRRRGFSRDEIREIKHLYQQIFRTPGERNYKRKALELANSGTAQTSRGQQFLHFFSNLRRPLARPVNEKLPE